MNIKSLLLGSAAALAVVSGAQAADAIVAAAPEPMEYVKVCDAFGKGYFYIPGTETCLSISGMVRYQVNWAKYGGWTTYTDKGGYYGNNSFFRLEVNAKNDSEVGTVYSFIRIQGDSSNAYQAGFFAGIDAGAVGLEVGKFDTAWTRFFGYGGYTDDGGSYSFMGNSYGAIQGKVGGISYIASVDDLTNTAGKSAGLNAAIKGTFDPVEAALGVDYDIAAKSFGMKGYVSGKFDMFSLKVMGLYASNASNVYAPAQGFTLLVGGKADLTDKFFAAVDYSYSFTPKTWNVVGDLGWNVASGFAVLAEGRYTSAKTAGAFLRFERDF